MKEIIIEMPSDCHITSVEFKPEQEELHLTVVKDWCNAVHTQLYGQLMSNTEGRQPILYDMPAKPPENNVIVLESDIDELLKITHYLEYECAKYQLLKSGTYQSISEQHQQNTQEQQYQGKFFIESAQTQHSDDDEDEAEQQSVERKIGKTK